MRILGVDVDRASGDVVIERVRARLSAGRRFTIMYANAHTLNTAVANEALRAALNGSDFVLNDGSGLALAGRLKRLPFPENLNGSDFNLRLLEVAAEEGRSVFLLGGRPGVAQQAATKLEAKIPRLRIAGTRDGFTGDAVADARAVVRSEADMVMVALGNPKQELWLARRLAEAGASLGVGVGAFLDFQAGRVPRAPAWMSRLGIEWVYRLAREPRRLWRRYIVGNPLFVARILRELARPTGGRA